MEIDIWQHQCDKFFIKEQNWISTLILPSFKYKLQSKAYIARTTAIPENMTAPHAPWLDIINIPTSEPLP